MGGRRTGGGEVGGPGEESVGAGAARSSGFPEAAGVTRTSGTAAAGGTHCGVMGAAGEGRTRAAGSAERAAAGVDRAERTI